MCSLRIFFAGSNTANFNIQIDDKQTTYGNEGYYTVFKVDYDETNVLGSNQGVATLRNCKITTILSSGSSNMFSNIGYKVCNSDTISHYIGIATYADTQIFNSDKNSIYNLNGNTGFRMTDGTYTLSFVLREVDSPGVDTYWYGRYNDRKNKMWSSGTANSNSYSDLENIDSGIAFSWQNRLIRPGQTLYFKMCPSPTDQSSSYKPSLTITSIANSYRPSSKPFLISGSLNHSRSSTTTFYIKYRFDNDKTIYTDTNAYVVSSTSPKDYSNNINIPDDFSSGSHTIKIWAEDRYGYRSTTYEKTFELVRNPPKISFTKNYENIVYKRNVDQIKISINASDPDGYGNFGISYFVSGISIQSNIITENRNYINEFSIDFPSNTAEDRYTVTLYCSNAYSGRSSTILYSFYYEFNSPVLSIEESTQK